MEEIENPGEEAASPTATQDQESAEIAPDGVSSDVDPETGVPFSEHPRWKEVYGSLKEFKSLGASPEQIRGALDRLAYYDQLAAEARQEAGRTTPTAEQADLDAKRLEAVKTLEQLIPGISKLPQIMQALEVKDHYQVESLRARAEDELADLMTKVGMPTKEADVYLMSEHLKTILQADKKLMAKYWTDPAAAVRGAWKQFVDTVATPLSRNERAATQQKGALLSSLPRAGQGGGGGSPSGTSAASPQTIDELFRQNKGLLIGKE